MRQYGEDIAVPVGNQPANRECQHDPNLLWSPSTRPISSLPHRQLRNASRRALVSVVKQHPKLTCYQRAILTRLRGLIAVFEPVGFIAGFDNVAVMGDAVEHGSRHLGASEKINYPKSGADYGPRMF